MANFKYKKSKKEQEEKMKDIEKYWGDIMRDTSLKTYHELIREGNLGPRQVKVLKAIEEIGECTDLMIAKHLNFPDPNSVRPRRKELYDMRIITEGKISKCPVSPVHRTVQWWKLNPLRKNKQVDLMGFEQ